jgi:hypothetical protein
VKTDEPVRIDCHQTMKDLYMSSKSISWSAAVVEAQLALFPVSKTRRS